MATPLVITMTLQSDAAAQLRQETANITASLAGIDAKMQDTARKTGQSADAWRAGLTGMSQAVTRNVVEQGNLSKAFLQTGQAAQTQQNQFEKLRAEYLKTQQGVRFLGVSLKELASGFGLVLGVQAGINAVKAFGSAMVQAALDMDTARLSMAAVTGSTTAAAAEMEVLRVISDKTGVGLDILTKQWAGLFAAVNQVPGRLESTREIFSTLIETSSRMGKSTEQIGLALYGLTQIAGGTTLQLQDMNQVTDALPGILPALTRELGLTQGEFRKLIGEGKILVDDVFPKLSGAIRSLAAGSGSVATLQSEFGRLRSAWTAFLDAIGQLGPIEALRLGLIGLAGALNTVAVAARDAKAAIFGLSEAQIVNNSLQNIQGRITETTKGIENIKNASTTGIGGLINDLMGLDQQTALATKEQELQNLIAAQTALLQSQKALGPTAGMAALSPDEKARAKLLEDLKAVKQTPVELRSAIAAIDQQLSTLRGKDVALINVLMGDQHTPQELRAFESKLVEDRQKLQDQLLGIDRKAGAKAAQEAGQSAVERAKAVEEALATSLQRQERQIEISADIQRRAIDAAASAALAEQGPGAVEAIAAQRMQDLRTVAEQTAQALETLRNNNLTEAAAAREIALKAEIAAAGKNHSAAVAAQEELLNLTADTEAKRAEITKKRGDVEQQLSKKSVDEQIKDAQQLNTLIQETAQDRIRARIEVNDAEIALIEAQIDGEVLTRQEGMARIQAIEQQRIEQTRQLYIAQAEAAIAAIDLEIRETARGQAEIAKIRGGLSDQLQALNIEQQTQQQEHQNDLTQGWREWVRDVQGAMGNFLFEWFDGQIKGIGDLLDRLKSYFFKIIADMVAYAATRTIVVPIVGAVLGGIGGAGGAAGTAVQGAGLLSQLFGGGGGTGGGGLLETGGLALTGIGLAKQLYSFLGLDSLMGSLRTGFTTLGESLLTGIDGMFGTAFSATEQAARESALLLADVTGDMGRGVAGAAGGGIGTVAGIAGGLAALGGGIYAALNASNTASRAAFAASAAAGAAAAASTAVATAVSSGLLTASAGTAALTGWTGIGLVVAAVMAVIGTVLDKVIKAEGPTVAVGAPGGLNVGAADGRLQLRGDAGSRIFRREGVDPGKARGIQAQLEEGITNAAIAAIDTINAVALDPAALLGPTQAALQAALKNVATINSSNAKKMEQDLSEQLRFANVQFIGGLLEPINRAFDQLRDMGDLEEQIQQLPGKTAGLIAIFTNLNQQLGEIGGSRNTDVLRQLSAVRNQVENFGNRIAGTAGQIAEEIVTSIIEQMQQTVVPTLAGQITQFSGLMNESFRALSTLRATQQMLEGAGLQGGQVGTQIDRLTKIMSETAERISTEIVSGALRDLAEELDQIIVQPLRVQATTVNGLFTDSMAALQALWNEWHRLEGEGIDATRVREQFDRLLGGMLDSVQQITEQSFATGNLTEFLRVLLSIPDALANMNPVTQQIRQMGVVFAAVAGPIQEVIDAARLDLQTPAQRAGDAAMRIMELSEAIGQTGDSIDQALPLYAQLSQAIQASAQAQIEVVNEQAEAQTTAIQEAYDAHLDAIRTWADASIAATNAYFDAETRAYDDWFDTHLEVINAAFDEELAAWDRWAETMMQGLQAFVDASTTMINDLADQANTTASQVETLNRAVLAEMSPAEQRSTLEARRDVFRAQAAGGGPGAEQAMTELISINQDLLSLAKQSDNLALQKQATDELKVLQKIMTDQLVAQTGESDPVLAQIKVALIQERYLKDIADYQKAQTEYITQTQQAAIEALEKRREDYLATMEIIRVRVQEAFELARNQKLDEIEAIREAHEEQLASSRDTQLKAVVHWQEETVRAIKEDMVYQLELVQYELQRMFAMQYQVLTGIALAPPTPPLHPSQRVTYDPTVPRHPDTPPVVILQHGGPVGFASGLYYAQGGMVPALLEPGERVIGGPFSMAQQGALMRMNQAFPRFANGGFTVPGSGSGDSVPAWLPSGSFVMNRSASRALGAQGGGMVHGSPAPAMPPIVIDLRGARFGSVADAHKVRDILEKDVIQIMEQYHRRTRVDTRIR